MDGSFPNFMATTNILRQAVKSLSYGDLSRGFLACDGGIEHDFTAALH